MQYGTKSRQRVVLPSGNWHEYVDHKPFNYGTLIDGNKNEGDVLDLYFLWICFVWSYYDGSQNDL